MPVAPPIDRRLSQVESQTFRLQEFLGQQNDRNGQSASGRAVYLAKTIKVGSTYPAVGSDTFGLRFIDRAFTPTQGTQTATDKARSATYQAVGRTIDGRYLKEGTVCLAVPTPAAPSADTGQVGRWAIIPISRGPFFGKAKADIAQNATDGSVERYWGGTEGDASIVDTVVNKWPKITSGSWLIYDDPDGDGTMYVISPSGGSSATGFSFKNVSGEAIGPHAVFGIGGEVTVGGAQYLEAGKPTSQFAPPWGVNNSGSTVADGATSSDGALFYDKAGPVVLDASATSVGENLAFGVKPNNWGLFPNRIGFLTSGPSYTLDGVTVVDCIQQQCTEVFGKLYAGVGNQLTQNSSGSATADFEIWFRGANGIMQVSGFDKLEVYAPFLQKNDSRQTNTWGRATRYGNFWEADFACDPDTNDTAQASPGAMNDGSIGYLLTIPPGPTPSVVNMSSGTTGTGTGH